MTIGTNIEYAKIEDLYLDPLNPRLGRGNTGKRVQQHEILELMKEWTLDELAVSFLESGFWIQEALLVVEDTLYDKKCLVVVEGSRRLATLIYLKDAIDGRPASRKWSEIAKSKKASKNLFEKIPYIKCSSRKEIEAFLGFRHVTGIKEWKPAEKAEYIARLIEDSGMTYDKVRRKIGSKTPAVRQHYISYRLLLQMEDQEDISIEHVEDKFSVLYLSLRTNGVKKYLDINIKAEPSVLLKPVPKNHLKQLASFALWLFGDEERSPLFTDSRKVDDFGTILENRKAVDYLERTDKPKFHVAYRIAGADEPELVKLVEGAADNVELALARAHLFKKSRKLQEAVRRLALGTFQILTMFPKVKTELKEEQ